MQKIHEHAQRLKNLTAEELDAIRIADEDTVRREQHESARACRYRDCGLTGSMRERTFTNYKPKTVSQTNAKGAAMRNELNWKVGAKGLFFYGDPGVGKGHLLQAWVNAMYEAGRISSYPIVFYRYVPTLIEELRQEYGRQKEQGSWEGMFSIRKQIDACGVLVFDDITKIDVRLHGAFLNIIGDRVNSAADTGKPTILMSSKYHPDAKEFPLDDAFASRIHQLMEICEIVGPDMRRTDNR